MNTNKKLIYTMIIIVCAGIGFIFLLTRPTQLRAALKELETSSSSAQVEQVYKQFKGLLTKDDQFETAVRTKLIKLNLSDSDNEDCTKWLPLLEPNLNIIIVPDLSGRINDTLNNPSQIENDKKLLNYIYERFSSESIRKHPTNAKDHLIVDVTGHNQANGNFRVLADSLNYDLSIVTKQSTRLYFETHKAKFSENINKLYTLARIRPQGADYWDYFNNDLNKNLKRSTLLENYRNVIVIISDGYLEAQNKNETGVAFYTGGYSQRMQVFNKLRSGESMEQALSGSVSPIMDCQSHFKNLEVLLLEVNPRHVKSKQEPVDKGTPQDARILRSIWTNWFKRLEVKNASKETVFNTRFDANDKTLRVIDDFFGWR